MTIETETLHTEFRYNTYLKVIPVFANYNSDIYGEKRQIKSIWEWRSDGELGLGLVPGAACTRMADVVFWWWFAATFTEMPPVGLVAVALVCAFCCHGDVRKGEVWGAGDGAMDPAALARAAVDLAAHT
jgi:hypothetical protein